MPDTYENKLKVTRVSNRINEIYKDLIDVSDCERECRESSFYSRAIAAMALEILCGISADVACRHITDGFGDLGIDAIYVDDSQQKIFMVQSKWKYKGVGGINNKEMLSFVEATKRLLESDFDGANDKLQRELNEINSALFNSNYLIQVVFAHTGNELVDNYCRRPLDTLINNVNDSDNTLVEFTELTIKDVYSYLVNGQNPLKINLSNVVLNDWGMIESPYKLYYGRISASDIGEWYKKYGNSLFAKNIRFYKGNTEVNNGMKQVLVNDPEKFFYYNNGIKLLCSSIERKAIHSTTNQMGLFELSNVSLVNGAQTTGAIGNVYEQNPDQVKNANVMIQIIDLSNADEDTARIITKLSNTQNRIDRKDFVSLDPEQDRLRSEMAFSHISYVYKNGDNLSEMNNQNDQILIDDAIVAMACWYDDIVYATMAKRNVGMLSEDINKPPYNVLFNSNTNTFTLINNVFIIRIIEKYLQTKQSQASGKERLVCVHGNRFIEHCVLQKQKLRSEYNDKVLDTAILELEIKSYIDLLVPKITEIICEQYPESYPATIFKNASKGKEIEKILKQTNAA